MVLMTQPHSKPAGFVEDVQLQGHIIDSLLFPKVLDEILTRGGSYVLKEIRIGQRQEDPSFARLEVAQTQPSSSKTSSTPSTIMAPSPVADRDCAYEQADLDGAFPEDFYSTTNYRTQVRLGGEWIEVEDQEMDCGILARPGGKAARCIPMVHVRQGDPHRRRPARAARPARRDGRPAAPVRVHA